MIKGTDDLPLPLFHGSSREIRTFGPLRTYDTAGIYFTPKYEDAADWAHCNSIEEGDNPTVMTAHLDIRNPFRMEGIDSQVISVERLDELIALGYDGVIGYIDDTPFEYVAFNAEQVRIVSVDHNPEQPAIFKM
jgi:hypothetical protein